MRKQAALVAILLAVPAAPAATLRCLKRSPAQVVRAHDLVFQARVAAASPRRCAGGWCGPGWLLEVERVWKGAAARRMVVPARSPDRVPLPLALGRRYLLAARVDEAGRPELHPCGIRPHLPADAYRLGVSEEPGLGPVKPTGAAGAWAPPHGPDHARETGMRFLDEGPRSAPVPTPPPGYRPLFPRWLRDRPDLWPEWARRR